MSIKLITHLEPANGNDFPLLEDKYFKGGFRVVDKLEHLDLINPLSRKEGMVVKVNEDDTAWQLNADMVTWDPFIVNVKGYDFKVGMYVYVSPIEGMIEYLFVDEVWFDVDFGESKVDAMTYHYDDVAVDIYKNRIEHIGQMVFEASTKTAYFKSLGNDHHFVEGDIMTFIYPELNRLEGISLTLKGSYVPFA